MIGLPAVILIDGRAGVGKTTLARRLSRCYGYSYLDSGILYRAAAWVSLRRASDTTGLLDGVVALAGQEPGRSPTVLLGERRLSRELWDSTITDHVATIASRPEVRLTVNAVCDALARAGQCILTGRDITRLQVPGAARIFLTCAHEPRLARLSARGEPSGRRDELESSFVPQEPSADDHLVRIDTTRLSIDEVFAMALQAIQARAWE